jgi:hypothetical protein
MRAEVGVLDTYWLKKEHRTQAIEAILDRKKELETETTAALHELEDEEASAPDQAPDPLENQPLPSAQAPH